jgi:hypothetical protein
VHRALVRAAARSGLLVLLAVLPGSACSRGAGEASAGAECTAETPLRPGIPGSPGHLLPSTVNPNGQSELAALMQSFVADLRAARAAVQAGRPVPAMLARHRRMRCAWPTDPADRSGAYDVRAQTYLARVAELESAPAEPAGDRAAAYGRVVAACRACHQVMCPGPLQAIDSLQLVAPAR